MNDCAALGKIQAQIQILKDQSEEIMKKILERNKEFEALNSVKE